MKKTFHLNRLALSVVTISTLCLFSSCDKETTTQSVTATSSVDELSKANLVAWYTFDGDTKDHSPNGNNVDFNNATPAAGRDGASNTAYLFNGTSSYMTVPNSPSLNPSSAITIIAVVKPQGFYQGKCHSNRILCKGYDDNDNGRYAMGYDDQPYWNYGGCEMPVKETKQNFYGSYGDGQGGASGVTDLATYVKQDKWYVLTYTFDGRRSTFYVNGAAQAANIKTTSFTPNSSALFIGRNEDPSYPYFFNGIIDEIRIYNTALSQSAIAKTGL